jgi:hypothetical protein
VHQAHQRHRAQRAIAVDQRHGHLMSLGVTTTDGQMSHQGCPQLRSEISDAVPGDG